MGRPIKWSFQPDKRHEAIAKDACGGYEKLKADIAEKEKMLAEIKQEQAAAISDLERGIKKEMYTECKREYDLSLIHICSGIRAAFRTNRSTKFSSLSVTRRCSFASIRISAKR